MNYKTSKMFIRQCDAIKDLMRIIHCNRNSLLYYTNLLDCETSNEFDKSYYRRQMKVLVGVIRDNKNMVKNLQRGLAEITGELKKVGSKFIIVKEEY